MGFDDSSMSKLIQVAGLPRSGTAWVAMLLSLNPRCLALHDVISIEEDWRGAIERGLQEWDWVADCGTYQYAPKASVPESIKIGILQDPEQSRLRANEAFRQQAPPGSYDALDERLLWWLQQDRNSLVVCRDDLWKDSTAARRIWEHAFGSAVSLPEEKVRFLLSMQVQRMNPEIAFADGSLSARTAQLF